MYPLIQFLRDWAVLETLYSTGCRVSEICNIQNKDVRLDDGTATVTGKGRKQRIVFINKRAKIAIFTYNKTKIEEDQKSESYLFIGIQELGESKKFKPGSVRHIIKRYVEATGLEKRVFPHLFRHSFATHLLDNGVNIM